MSRRVDLINLIRLSSFKVRSPICKAQARVAESIFWGLLRSERIEIYSWAAVSPLCVHTSEGMKRTYLILLRSLWCMKNANASCFCLLRNCVQPCLCMRMVCVCFNAELKTPIDSQSCDFKVDDTLSDRIRVLQTSA